MHVIPHPLDMGLKPLDLDDWLKSQPNDHLLLAERQELIQSKPECVIAARPAAESAVRELSGALSDRFPEGVRTENAEDYLEFIGARLAEDICVLSPDEDGYRLTAAVLCFPNRWKLHEKMGRTVTEIHDPVPEYAEGASRVVDRFLAKLRPLRAFERSNWGIVLSPTLFHPDRADPVTQKNLSRSFLRVEKQSFLKLPESKAIIFSIRTSIVPWTELSGGTQDAVMQTARSLSGEWLAYKALDLVDNG